jgi:hypothetical protein
MKTKNYELQKNTSIVLRKKIALVLVFIGMLTLQSCTIYEDDDPIDDDTISEVFELQNVNFQYDPINGYNIYVPFNPQIFPSDVVLIYRLSGVINSNTPIWQSIPRTLYLNEGELDYDFDFSSVDFTIYAGGNYNLATTPSYITNQTFRIVIVPAYFGRNSNLDLNDYNAVIRAFNIDDSKIVKINL